MGLSIDALREKYVDTGACTNDDVAAYVKDAKDPTVWCLYYATVRVVAKKPE